MTTANGSSHNNLEEEEEDPLDKLLREIFQSVDTDSSVSQSAQDVSEFLEPFRRQPQVDRKTNVLQWWETKQKIYPQLYVMAQIVLSLPVTQVSVERLFSGLKFILSDLRYSMKSPILNDLMIVRTNNCLTKML